MARVRGSRRLVAVSLLVLGVGACAGVKTKTPAWKTVTGDDMAERLDRWIAALNARDDAALAAVYAPAATAVDAESGLTFAGRERILSTLYAGAWESRPPRVLSRGLLLVRGRDLVAVLVSRVTPDAEEGRLWALEWSLDEKGRVVREVHHADPGLGLATGAPARMATHRAWVAGEVEVSLGTDAERRNIEVVAGLVQSGADLRDVAASAVRGAPAPPGIWGAGPWVVVHGEGLEIYRFGPGGLRDMWGFTAGRAYGMHLGEVHVEAGDE